MAPSLPGEPSSQRISRSENRLAGQAYLWLLRSEALFDSVAQRWRLVGSVRLIAGSDLVGRTVDPGDLMSFLGRQRPIDCCMAVGSCLGHFRHRWAVRNP